ncbi:MAG TPA: DUF3090 family protein [Tepidiformaceae bacterium]|jgi:uncharacterized repeat protein (TIGR03847 family)
MATPRELGPLSHLSAEAIGQPGQRRFCLKALSEQGESAVLWLEKEQLVALGDAIETVLENEGYTYERPPLDDAPADPPFPLSAGTEMQVAQLSMGVNRERQSIVLIGADAPEPESVTEALSMALDYRRGYELRQQIREVVAAGRPPCPLCGAPIDPTGHICPKSNGHHPH